MSDQKSGKGTTEKKKNELNEGQLDKAVGGARAGSGAAGTTPTPGTAIPGN